jgi:hypothetical protein
MIQTDRFILSYLRKQVSSGLASEWIRRFRGNDIQVLSACCMRFSNVAVLKIGQFEEIRKLL